MPQKWQEVVWTSNVKTCLLISNCDGQTWADRQSFCACSDLFSPILAKQLKMLQLVWVLGDPVRSLQSCQQTNKQSNKLTECLLRSHVSGLTEQTFTQLDCKYSKVNSACVLNWITPGYIYISRLTHFKFEYCAGAIACRGWREG